ncbi:ribonuclease III [Lacicoccus qingdaonensis]|uniref:Ribonuclease 3 n=1 Tax=Lacicoccus qingdaonensis TaxID=576118 RepID=A0A1G9A7M6_9BACL|nr:ribonuclease III [Salinicoccus qingdaonensis]SDK23346.1 RNAse III [Salinicoccus qingdaonensis]
MKEISNRVKKDKYALDKLDSFNTLFKEFQKKINLDLGEHQIYQQAFMHSSFINDLNLNKIYNNERLEFLGDAVLELMVSDFIYKKFPELPEGDLTKLRANIVCEPSLVVFAVKLKMPELIILGKGEEKTEGRNRPSIISDTFEAFLGALYLQEGHKTAEKFLQNHVLVDIKDAHYNAVVDYKTLLQEETHKKYNKELQYKLLKESGPSHNKSFESGVFIDGRQLGTGRGRSKKESEQRAAENALFMIHD